MNNSIAPINDKNLKIFDEICAERFSQLNLECILVSIIDNVPSDALPHLAEQYHITGNEGWLQALNEQEKRELIKSSIKIHRYKGTKYAIEEVLKTINIAGKIEEWFEYNGKPYYFKVILNVFNKTLEEDLENKLLKLIDEYKNERSHLEKIEIYLASKAETVFYPRILSGETITVKGKE